ncbi:MAG TPA: glucose-1-phosphate adenylyltransferase [Burkholderiales bacterium]|nr:glucose-1-phosphate adenylyltransferase [Burkholderiales bacterium]
MNDLVNVQPGYGAYKQYAPDDPTMAHLAKQTLALVLAGGRGSRLGPLTDWRAKPAVPFGGKFRIIDFALSNCVNSGIRRIGIATQYKAQSLIHHVQRGWAFLDGRFNEFIELLPAQQRITADWYKGTADAVIQNLDILRRHDPRIVLVLAGDHVYKMDYARMIDEHVARRADMTVGCVEVPLAEATQFGVMEVDEKFQVTGFQEKPANPKPIPGRPDTALGSMGIYVFNAPFLYEQLIRDADDPDSDHDFGHNIIPHLVATGYRVSAHRLQDSCTQLNDGRPYWRDVGTIDAYWEANMELTRVSPALDLYDQSWPIWTYQEQQPPAKFIFDSDGRRGAAIDSMVSGGCIISGSTIKCSLLFSSVRIHSYCSIEQAVILPEVEVGRGAVLRRVVVDRGAHIPPGLQVGVDPEEDRRRFHVSDNGVTLITPEMLGQQLHHLR